ncbi:Uncharacterised protein [Klebsiella pneumoniae]|nr:Uncharacterised protein [Klebsiella pneumoniae]
MFRVKVLVCQSVVTPLNHFVVELSQFTGSDKSAITPTVSVDTFVIVTELRTSRLSVKTVPASTGTFVMFAVRMEAVVVCKAFSASLYVNPEPVPESTHSDKSDSIPPLPMRLPEDSDPFSMVKRLPCDVSIPSLALTRSLSILTAALSAFLATFPLVMLRLF